MAYQTTTTDYWEINSIPLSTYAWNITSLGAKFGTPPLRGTNVEQAYRPGAMFRPKVAASRTISLAMWVLGADVEQSTSAGTANSRATVQSNLRELMRLFHSPRTQLAVTKRWTDEEGTHAATGYAQVVDAVSPEFTGAQRATFMVDLLFADPFFYGTEVTQALALSTPVTLENPGDDSSPANLTVNFIGPLLNPLLVNSATSPSVWCKYLGAVDTGATVVLDVLSPRASVGTVPVISGVYNGGSLWWMEVFPGDNPLMLTADSGTGSASVVYKPAYL